MDLEPNGGGSMEYVVVTRKISTPPAYDSVTGEPIREKGKLITESTYSISYAVTTVLRCKPDAVLLSRATTNVQAPPHTKYHIL